MSQGYKFVYVYYESAGRWKAVKAERGYSGPTIKNYWLAYGEAELATKKKLRPTARNRRAVFANAKERESAEQLAPLIRKLQLEAALEKGLKGTFPASDAVAVIQPAPERGILSDLDLMRSIADELTKRKLQTPRGGAWHPQLVKRIVERLDVSQNNAAKSGSVN